MNRKKNRKDKHTKKSRRDRAKKTELLTARDILRTSVPAKIVFVYDLHIFILAQTFSKI